MSIPNKSNRKTLVPKRYSDVPLLNNQGSRHEISVLNNVNTSIKRPHDDKTPNSEDESAKRPKIAFNVPSFRSPLLQSPLITTPLQQSSSHSSSSSRKNIANKRLQDLRKNLEAQRSMVERKITERMNKTPTSDDAYKTVLNSPKPENKINKDVPLRGTSSSAPCTASSVQSRIHSFNMSNDVKNNNSNNTITTSNVNAINETLKINDDDVHVRSEIKQSSSQYRFLPSDSGEFDRSGVNMDDSMEWEPVDEDTVLNNVFWFGSAMFQWSFMARQLVTDINKIRKEISYDKKLPIVDILNNSDPLKASQNGVFIVVDTNIFLSQMNVLVQLRRTEFKDFNRATIIVPWMVLQELDYMKETKGCHLGKNARKAVAYINKQLVLNDPYFKGQTVLEATKQDICSNNADDGILNCCMQLVADNKYVILLSNDINLRNKVLVNKIQAYNSNDIIEYLNKLNLPQFNETHKTNIDKLRLILSNMLTHVVESEMRKAYGDIWLKMVKTSPPYTMIEALTLMHKYWVSVFSFSLQKQAQNKIEEFLIFSKRHENDINYTQETYNKFMENSLTLCVYLKNGYPCYKFLIMESLTNIQKCV